MDLPQVQESERLEAATPLGDSESLERLRERTEDSTTRPAGSTALLDGKIPASADRATEPEPRPAGGRELTADGIGRSPGVLS